jgi:hypothetical protein
MKRSIMLRTKRGGLASRIIAHAVERDLPAVIRHEQHAARRDVLDAVALDAEPVAVQVHERGRRQAHGVDVGAERVVADLVGGQRHRAADAVVEIVAGDARRKRDRAVGEALDGGAQRTVHARGERAPDRRTTR